ncbi:flavodoxin domain-containing protein [Dethiobacter alkaliphilus]|uniref:flavodoxin domain-containing protein n=1 Tax=Dethiobacter alkaliphilus TaxID=427926 RepID=UPI002225E3C9|nr:flavodoxin domain-containing protein [Dethiobacter alkaliphilus]MCW3491587.1 flavodoxin domain-containing protein [Dethiobacter alkaliphilus]
MASILLLYRTRTGFTKKYVDWITQEIACRTVPWEQINNVDINSFDIIIYGAGMHAGRIQGLREFKKMTSGLVGKRIVVFATGAAPNTEEIVAKLKADNFSENELIHIPFFYFQSGMNYEKMSLSGKAIMKVYSKFLELKNNKSDIEDGTSKAILNSYDHSCRAYIKPMVNCLKEFLTKDGGTHIIG